MKFLKFIIPATLGLVVALAISCGPQKPSFIPKQPPAPTRENKAGHETSPYLVFVSIDGYRHDYTAKYNPPTISEIANGGVQAESLQPSFPSNTFPNHYALITGMVPANNGIISNFFYDKSRKEYYAMNDSKAVKDPSWYRGTPLWRAVSQAGMLSATVYWVGSEAPIAGDTADYYLTWNPHKSNEERVDQVIDWLSLPLEKRPHFVSLYFEDVDSAGHKKGPDSIEVRDAIMGIDKALSRLNDFAKKNNINIVIVSDHGMTMKGEHIALNDKGGVDLSGFTVQESGAIALLYSDDQKLINKTVQDINSRKEWIGKLKAYRREDVPKSLNFNSDSQRVGDVVVIAKMPIMIQIKKDAAPANPNIMAAAGGNIATHGWTFDNKDMHGIFYASGPAFKQSLTIPSFHNVHVYPMILEVMGIPMQAAQKIDGRADVLHEILK